MSSDPEARVERLQAAIEGFRSVGRVVDEGRARLDLAGILDATGGDSTSERQRAAALLEERGIRVFTSRIPSAADASGAAGGMDRPDPG